MKAIVCTKYGSPDVLQFREVEKPTPKDNEVLVKVHAASLNAADFEYLRGMFFVRLAAPLKPTFKIFGSDIAGQVEAVGRKVKQFQPGDEVFGDLTQRVTSIDNRYYFAGFKKLFHKIQTLVWFMHQDTHFLTPCH